MKDFLNGICYLLDGFCLLVKPGIRRFVIVPVLVNTTLFIGLFWASWYGMGHLNLWLGHYLPSWLQWLTYVLWFFFAISFFLAAVYTFVTFANLIAAPFNSFLSEKVEFYLTGELTNDMTFWQNVKDVPRIVGRQLGIVLYYLPRACLLLLLFIIPLIQIIAGFCWFLFHAWTLSLTYLDYPSDNHRVPMSKVREFARKKRLVSFGFGVAVVFALSVPLINFLAIPAAVAGATKLWIEERGNAA